MPDDRGRAERDYLSTLLNSPAEIHVVAGLAIFGIESAYTIEGPTVKRHVTTWNMFGDCIREQNMVWSARRRSNARLDPILCRRRDVWSSDSGVIATDKRANQVVQPINVRHAVGIGVGQYFALGSSRSRVASVTQSMVGLMNVSHPRELRGDAGSVISRTIVDENNFVSRII